MANSKRDQVILACSECGEHNYITTRNKRNHPNKMETMKYCSRCKKETLHKEAK
ncbi:MAG: 50S ribosomal protein L33 [Erysipelotrichaceae bacterium]|nr:50S ribosomal protein L33 [Erysipelotrichaceae bacterium]